MTTGYLERQAKLRFPAGTDVEIVEPYIEYGTNATLKVGLRVKTTGSIGQYKKVYKKHGLMISAGVEISHSEIGTIIVPVDILRPIDMEGLDETSA